MTDSDYTLLRRAPRSYVVGTAYRGWTVDVQGPADASYRWGRVFGNLNSCLWIYEGAITGDATADSFVLGRAPDHSNLPLHQWPDRRRPQRRRSHRHGCRCWVRNL